MDFNPGLIDHAIQKDIVRTLMSESKAKFSQLRPERVESNLFMYHLNQLIKRGVVEKENGVYTLSSKGRLFIDRANLDKLVFRVQPKILTILTIQSGKDRWLLLERTHEPHMNRIGFPSGKVHYGESLQESAERELAEKSGLSALRLNLRGNIIMRFLDKETKQTMNHIIGYVFYADVADEAELNTASDYWRALWGDESQLKQGNVFKGHSDILDLLANREQFLASFDYESDF